MLRREVRPPSLIGGQSEGRCADQEHLEDGLGVGRN
jgi:hypothetical protein